MRSESVEHAEAVERVVGGRHAMRKLLGRIIGADGHDLQPQRPYLLALLKRHPTEGHDGFAELLIDLRGPVFGGTNEAIHVAAETHRTNAERPDSTAG